MRKLSDTQKNFNLEAAQAYQEALPGSPAEEFLGKRGLLKPRVKEFGLGYVADERPGLERFVGMLCIPYYRPTYDGSDLVVTMRFRCLEDHEHMYHGKYNSLEADRPRMFNTKALVETSPSIAICEGELDAITAEVCGVPAVGIPGAQLWKPAFRDVFLGYETVWILADGDEAGRHLAATIKKELPNSKHIPMPSGLDVNDVYLRDGDIKESLS